MIAFVCNPYLAVLQKRTYEKYWKDEVDEVLINVNGRNDTIRKFIVDLWKDDDKVVFVDEVPKEIRQGPAFNRLYPHVTGNVLMTIDSDNFIYKKGIVSEFGRLIVEGIHDSIGSMGLHAYPQEMMRKITGKYGTVRLNPFMAFFNNDIIKQIKDIDFGTEAFKKGDVIPYLGGMEHNGWIDIMGKLCIQFFQISKNYYLIKATEPGKYYHMSGISSLYRRKFRSLEDDDEQKFRAGSLDAFQNHGYWAMYYTLYQSTKGEVPFPDYNKEYEEGFHHNLRQSGSSYEVMKEVEADIKKTHEGLF